MPDPNAKRDAELKNIAGSVKELVKVLETINTNLVAGIKAIVEVPAETSSVPKPPYTQKHLPYLDKLHEEMGLDSWWQRSEQRQIVLNTPDA